MAPNIDSMAAHQNGATAGILHHGGVHAVGQVALVGCVVNNRHHQLLIVAQITLIGIIVNAL